MTTRTWCLNTEVAAGLQTRQQLMNRHLCENKKVHVHTQRPIALPTSQQCFIVSSLCITTFSLSSSPFSPTSATSLGDKRAASSRRGGSLFANQMLFPPDLSPQDATSLATTTLFFSLQPLSSQPRLEDLLHWYSAALPMLPAKGADVAVCLVAALLKRMTCEDVAASRKPDWHSAQVRLQVSQLSAVVTLGIKHVARDSSVQLLTMLVEANACVGVSDRYSGLTTRGGSSVNSSISIDAKNGRASSNMMSCLLDACLSCDGRPPSANQVLSTVISMLYLQVPPLYPQVFMDSLCRAVAESPTVPAQLLMLLPRAATLCFKQQSLLDHGSKPSSLPQLFMPVYESKLLKAANNIILPQLPSLVLQPLLLLGHPVASQNLLEAATADLLDAYAFFEPSTADDVKDPRLALLADASTILLTASAGYAAMDCSLRRSLDSLVTQSLQLANAASVIPPSALPWQCGPMEAALVYAVTRYILHTGSASSVSLSPTLHISLPLPNNGDKPSKEPQELVKSGGEDRGQWLRSMVGLVKAGVLAPASPGQAWVGLNDSQLIAVSYGIAVELGEELAEAGLKEEFQRLLAGPVSTAVVSQGLANTA